MKYITVKLTEDQLHAVHRILDYGKSEKTMNYTTGKMEYDLPSDRQYNAFLTRIQTKLERALAKAKTNVTN